MPAASACPSKIDELETSISARFEAVVKRNPEAIAVSHHGRTWTYRQLNRRADEIALAIQKRDPSDTPVALAGDTSITMVAAVLATFKLGRPFVFIGPELPDSRSEYLLKTTGCRCIYCESPEHQRGVFRELDLKILGPESKVDFSEGQDPLPSPAPDDLAYIIFTSGSTGRPKGVPQTHRAVLADILRQGRDLRTSPSDVYGLLYSLGGSAAICHLCGSLLHGARLSIFDLRKDGFRELIQWLETEKVTILDINVSTFRQMCRNLDQKPNRFPHLRLLAPGSEPVHRYDLDLFERHFSDQCVLQNAFGTSETRTVTQYFISKGDDYEYEGENISIGVPVDRKEVLLLDRDGLKVDDGDVGEMVVRSRYIASGYWNEPDLSKERFHEDPEEPGYRLYFTNDLAKRLPSGRLVHLGRKDFSAKINGLLVAYAEVEAALRSHRSVVDAAVVAVDGPGGKKSLAGFVVLTPDESLPLQDLKAHLAERLPPQMVPAIVRFTKGLPHLANGKLNRRELIDSLQHANCSRQGQLDPPRPGLEEAVAGAFTEVLGIAPISRSDNFFDLGGDSLLALSLTLEIERRFQTNIPVAGVVRLSTPKALASWLESMEQGHPAPASDGEKLLSLSFEPHLPSIFVVPGLIGIGYEFSGMAAAWKDVYSLGSLQHAGMDGATVPHRTIEEAAEDMADTIMRHNPESQLVIIGYSFGALAAYETARLFAEKGLTAHAILLDFPNRKSILSRGDLIRGYARLKGGLHSIRSGLSGKSLGDKTDFLFNYLNRQASGFHRRYANLRSIKSMPDATVKVPADDWMNLVWDAQKHASRCYRPQATRARLTLIRANDGFDAHGADQESGLGWEKLALNGFELAHIDGDHQSILDGNLEQTLAILDRVLASPANQNSLKPSIPES